jgi:hypothetical protein
VNQARTAAIHQPNFFPWLGYFDKIARCDVFIVLDDVQYQKTGSSWSNRVMLALAGEARWVTAPLRRPAHGTQRIDELEWAPQPWREKLLKSLETAYRRAPFHAEAMQLLEPLVRNPESRVAAYNVQAIQAIAAALGLDRRFLLASSFAVHATATERLIELVRRAGCDTYLCGGGAGGYQDDQLFAAAGLHLQYQAFAHPQYTQHAAKEFLPGLSVVDALMNCGIARTRNFLIS